MQRGGVKRSTDESSIEENNASVVTKDYAVKKTTCVQNRTIVIEENAIAKAYDVDLPAPIPSTSSERPRIYVNDSKSGPKQHACLYCGKLYFKIARHLTRVHKDEEDVKKINALKTKDPIRLEKIRKIRCDGDAKHNLVIKPGAKEHELIVLRRPRNHVRTIEKTPSDFAFCPSCKVLTSKKFLSAHFASCSGQTGKHRRIIKKISKIYENDFHPDTCKKLRRLIAHMHVDEASKTLKYDYLLIHYGNMLCDKYKNPQTDELIRNRLRLLARLLNTVKAVEAEIIKKKKSNRQIHSKTPVTDMISLFDPENVKICIKAVNILAAEEICELPIVLSRACGIDNATNTVDNSPAQDDITDGSSESDESDSESNVNDHVEVSEKSGDEDLDINITIPIKRRIWTPSEISALKEHFAEKLAQRKYPTEEEMTAVRSKDPRLTRRENPLIRSWFSNLYHKKKKQ
ncbi:Protein of unknown function [Cotesia congregata]|uniref:Homeobox domain-containing protein n=1 Tax=Cotesia congregata TaxID=51543 RepID=A0A8J2HEV8_COTCN|nr:Protein of unknown function [Cotesia congregata]